MPDHEQEVTSWTPGFILSQEWTDLPAGCLLTFWGRGPHGPFELRVPARPVLFIPRHCVLPTDVSPAERRSLDLHDLDGRPVDVLYFHLARDLRQAREVCARTGIPVMEGDINPASRYLMERFIHGSCEFSGEPDVHDGVAVYHQPHIRPGTWTPALSLLSFDIETGSAGQLYAIAHVFEDGERRERRVYLAGRGRARREPPLQPCATESELLQRFLDDVHALDPDLLTGWNILGFDLPFLADKCREHGLPLTLGRRRLEARLYEAGGRRQAAVPGRVVADGIPLLRATPLHVDDFRLGTVAQAVLGESKELHFEDLDKQREIDRLFIEDRLSLAAYNLRDAELVARIFARTRLVEQMISRSRISGMLPDRIGRSVAAFDYFFLPRLHRKGRVAPDREAEENGEPLPGGLILPPHPGVHDHVVVLDFKSLYPSVIRTFCICPYAKRLAERDPVTTPTGHRFSSSEQILPDYIAELMTRRAQARAAGDAPLAQAVKTLMNSFYGVLGSPGSRFYDPDLATAITGSGQWILRAARDHLEVGGYTVLYGDTDSLFVLLPARDTAHAHAAGASLAAAVNGFLAAELRTRFGVTSVLEIVFQRYFRRLYFPAARHGRGASAPPGDDDAEHAGEGAAKRYAGLAVDAEGRETLKVTGMESVRSDWTPLAHRLQRAALERFFHGAPLADWLRAEVQALRSGAHDDELVYRRRLRKSLASYTHNVPPHVRAARLLPPEQQHRLGSVAYVVTLRGPVPVALPHNDPDYAYYVERQVRPVVEELLELSGRTFDGAINGREQLELF